jgi:dihydroorotate dehydrogenase
MIFYPPLRSVLFRLDPESAHALAIRYLGVLPSVPVAGGLSRWSHRVDDERLRQELFGARFPNPVGLAAGFDKNGEVVRAWPLLGFGFGEVGTVTPRAQEGNPRPRLFRYPRHESLQNAMGFNNDGMDALAKRLGRVYPFELPIGVNIGKNRDTPLEEAEGDYRIQLEALSPLCDFFVINLSSPNTPGLRDLQTRATVRSLLGAARELTPRPVLVKISPDLEPAHAIRVASTAVEEGAAGIVVANTTTDYDLLPGARDFGGISGAVLRERSFALLEILAAELFGRTVLISVGGIDSGEEAWRRLRAGASLVQIYSALVFRGPGLAAEINRDLVRRMQAEGVGSLAEVIGADRRSPTC